MSLQSQDFDQNNIELAEKVADYLSQHPDFFMQYPTVLPALNIPHETGEAVSLVQHQIKALRAEVQKYRVQLEHLVNIARENHDTATRLHHLTLSLIETQSADEVLHTLQDTLCELLNADTVAIKLFDRDACPAMFQAFLHNNCPSCGELPKEQIDYLFGGQATDARSVALIPIYSANLTGVLAIGSHAAERFSANKSVDFLQRLGEIISTKLNAINQPK